MTEKSPVELREQRARLIASTGLTETVLRERADAHQLYPEHYDIWATVEGLDMHLAEVAEGEQSPELKEAQAQARGWEEKYFELVERYTPLAVQAAALREWGPVLRRAVELLPSKCSYHDETHPHGVWREACCDTGVPARRRALAEKALAALTAEEAK
ncbi:hypothetical protein [Streptomyces sp. or20]|uniref:hypothetical protein n=1 Tax=Streptomyces sp. or20 TaxID=1828016 RepID=UPI000BF0E193|nr:hypothetical protein [Streptomyces sp. or20]